MQQLQYHSAWIKQVDSTLDQQIQKAFIQTRENEDQIIVPLRQAINHKGDYLLTVLLHNREQQILNLSTVHLSVSSLYFQANQQHFSSAEWSVEPMTSAPWTFIFSESNYSGELTDDISNLTIEFTSSNQN
ncbi:SLAP domain-containing protein [Allobacillus sp. GCM10007491]|uniref:SLAP domain-containing protein n=1 Tax=Allobacillus saliphilus TaxID=2912308 RepID=A0A941CVU0_9BACI|nr:SLAP domain-containing protein [uncultured Allobacillus sp.]MBR7553441.1 SLAP domain-containing protein [Allobacillus saliphilus]